MNKHFFKNINKSLNISGADEETTQLLSYCTGVHLHFMFNAILYFYELLFCIYVYICYRGPLGRLAKLAKGATLWKYCINKK